MTQPFEAYNNDDNQVLEVSPQSEPPIESPEGRRRMTREVFDRTIKIFNLIDRLDDRQLERLKGIGRRKHGSEFDIYTMIKTDERSLSISFSKYYDTLHYNANFNMTHPIGIPYVYVEFPTAIYQKKDVDIQTLPYDTVIASSVGYDIFVTGEVTSTAQNYVFTNMADDEDEDDGDIDQKDVVGNDDVTKKEELTVMYSEVSERIQKMEDLLQEFREKEDKRQQRRTQQ